MEYGLLATWLALYLRYCTLAGPSRDSVPPLRRPSTRIRRPGCRLDLWLATCFVGRLSLTLGIWLGVAVLAVSTLAVGGATWTERPTSRRRPGVHVAFLFVVGIRALDPAVTPAAARSSSTSASSSRSPARRSSRRRICGSPASRSATTTAVTSRRFSRGLTATAGQFAYNLALAGFYATLSRRRTDWPALRERTRPPARVAAGLTAIGDGVASNLSTPAKFVSASTRWAGPDSCRAGWLRTRRARGGAGLVRYWDASRVIEDSAADFVRTNPVIPGTINEFPLFAWLNGDLHAHMMGTPFLLLAAALASLLPDAGRRTPATARTLFGALPAVAGIRP